MLRGGGFSGRAGDVSVYVSLNGVDYPESNLMSKIRFAYTGVTPTPKPTAVPTPTPTLPPPPSPFPPRQLVRAAHRRASAADVLPSVFV